MKDGNPKHIDYIRCAGPFAESVGCSVCIKSCIFFKGDFEKIRQLQKKKSV
jgi:epoxyqueuosine reductase